MTQARVVVSGDVRSVGRALGDRTRLALLRHVQAADGPVGVRELAEHFGLHGNAVRQHLACLRDAGLVIEEVERTGRTGRPRLAYRPDPESTGVLAGWNPYEVLSRLLVEVAAGRTAREVGAAYGRRVAETAPEQDPVELFAGVARRHGFRPSLHELDDGAELVLGHCPFAASVTGDGLVCDLHRGIADGIAGACDGAEVTGLEVASPQQGGCRLHLRIHSHEGERP